MTKSQSLKAFIAGMTFPAIFLPLAYTCFYYFKADVLRNNPYQFIPMYIPLLFGLTNAFYVWLRGKKPSQHNHCRLWLFGGVLGLLVACFGTFIMHIPSVLFGLDHGWEYLPLVALPIIYGAIFRFIVKGLNHLVNV